jgi:hypothetical protein
MACFQLAVKDNNLIDCVSVAYPSLAVKGEIDELAVPNQIIAPEIDPTLRPELKEYSNRVIPTLRIPYHYDYYPGFGAWICRKGKSQR